MNRPFIIDGAPPESCGWRSTRRMNYSYKYRDHWLVIFVRPNGTWSFGIDGAWGSMPFDTWQGAAAFGCNEIDEIVVNEEALS